MKTERNTKIDRSQKASKSNLMEKLIDPHQEY